MTPLVFEGKVDAWFLAAFYGGAALMVATAFLPRMPRWGRPVLVLLACVFAAIALTSGAREYALYPDGRVAVEGWPYGSTLFRVHDVVRVAPSNDPRSSEAPSLDRLRVDHAPGGEPRVVFIAPADKQAFVDALARADPRLVQRGLTLAR